MNIVVQTGQSMLPSVIFMTYLVVCPGIWGAYWGIEISSRRCDAEASLKLTEELIPSTVAIALNSAWDGVTAPVQTKHVHQSEVRCHLGGNHRLTVGDLLFSASNLGGNLCVG